MFVQLAGKYSNILSIGVRICVLLHSFLCLPSLDLDLEGLGAGVSAWVVRLLCNW